MASFSRKDAYWEWLNMLDEMECEILKVLSGPKNSFQSVLKAFSYSSSVLPALNLLIGNRIDIAVLKFKLHEYIISLSPEKDTALFRGLI